MKRRTETDLTREVLTALGLYPAVVVAWRSNSGAVKVRGGYMTLAPKGTADVIGYFVGSARFFGVETKKSHPDSCSCPKCEGQRAWGAKLTSQGGLYVGRVRSVEDALLGLGLLQRDDHARAG